MMEQTVNGGLMLCTITVIKAATVLKAFGIFGSKMPAVQQPQIPIQQDVQSIANYKTQQAMMSMAKSGREATNMTSQKFGG